MRRALERSLVGLVAVAVAIGWVARTPSGADGASQNRTESSIALFMLEHRLGPVKRFAHAMDGTIRGLQSPASVCSGKVQIAILSPGDEMRTLFEKRAKEQQQALKFLFNQELFDSMDAIPYWRTVIASRLARYLQVGEQTSIGPVVAIAAPADCTQAWTAPWTRFRPQ